MPRTAKPRTDNLLTRNLTNRAITTRLLLAVLLGVPNSSLAQYTAPKIEVTYNDAAPTSAAPLQVAEKAVIQPQVIEGRLSPGYSYITLNFGVVSDVSAQVSVESSNPKLIIQLPGGKLLLNAQTLTSVTAMAEGAQEGVIRVRNSLGKVIAEAPYRIGENKRLNQNASVNYSPTVNQFNASYSASLSPASIFGPRLSASVGLSVNVSSGDVGGNIGVNVSW